MLCQIYKFIKDAFCFDFLILVSMFDVYILLGSNLGKSLDFLIQAKQMINKEVGTVFLESSLYRSEPWGFKHENYFYNQVIAIKSSDNPSNILEKCLNIEKNMGRIRNENSNHYVARKIDIDILFINNITINSENLIVPHPRLAERMFTLMPLNEIIPNFIHPTFKKTIFDLYKACDDHSKVEKL